MNTTSIVYLGVLGCSAACAEAPRSPVPDTPGTSVDAGLAGDGETRHRATTSDAERSASTQSGDPGPNDAGAPDAEDEPHPAASTAASNPEPVTKPDGGERELSPPLGTRNFACQPSKSPLFESQEPLKMWISGDFTRVNTEPNREDATSPGLIDPDGPGPLEAVPVDIRARGHLRYLECGYRPFKVVFEEKQKDNVFHKLGKSVKFSTHCGDREEMDPVLQAPNLEEYYQRVRMEHAAYQLVGALETLSLKTRLVELTYHDTATDTEQTHLAFIREPEDEMAQRCDMVEGEDIPLDEPVGTNHRAELLLFLVNNFILQADVKNKIELRDLDRREQVWAPYDFDLLGIFRRDFFKLKGRTLEENNAAFADWLRRNQSPELFEEVDLLLTRSDAMQAVIDGAGLNPENEQLFREWFSLFLATLRDFRRCGEGAASPDDLACHVLDDYPDTFADATWVELGEQQVWLEPPGDKDFVRVALDASRLYSFVSRTPARILSADGQLVQSVPAVVWGAVGTSFSLEPNEASAYHVEFDHGASLVCSDMWANDVNAQYHAWAFYADDHGNLPELATPLTPTVTSHGSWELDTLTNVFDEDWFRLEVTEATTLTLRFEGSGAGNIDAFDVDAPDVAVGSVELFPPVAESIDLTELFPQPGTYLIRLLQSFGDGAYELDLQ